MLRGARAGVPAELASRGKGGVPAERSVAAVGARAFRRNRKTGKRARPGRVSRILSPRGMRGPVICLKRPTRDGAAGVSRRTERTAPPPPIGPCTGRGLPCAAPLGLRTVVSCTAVSPLPRLRAAVSFLWRFPSPAFAAGVPHLPARTSCPAVSGLSSGGNPPATGVRAALEIAKEPHSRHG